MKFLVPFHGLTIYPAYADNFLNNKDSLMKTNLAIAAALATIMTTGVIDTAEAGDKKKKEKCYGISTAGANDCANLAGTHSCAGQSTVDNDIGEWRLVPGGTCSDLGGFDRKEAKKMFKAMKAKKNG
ncbi:MAG: putative membrane protein [Glaciecola sp.]